MFVIRNPNTIEVYTSPKTRLCISPQGAEPQVVFSVLSSTNITVHKNCDNQEQCGVCSMHGKAYIFLSLEKKYQFICVKHKQI